MAIYCQKCGTENTEEAAFCRNCGTALKSTKLPSKLSSFSVPAFILGICALFVFWCPFVDIILSGLGLVFAILALQKSKQGGKKSLAIASIVILIPAIILSFAMTLSFSLYRDSSNDESTSSVVTESTQNSAATTSTTTTTTKLTTTTTKLTTTKSPAEIKADYIASCSKGDYKAIARQPDSYDGKRIYFRGEVMQVQESWFNTIYLIRVTENEYGFWEDIVYVTYTVPDGAPKVLEEDIVMFYGECKGDYSYTTVLGASSTVPKFEVEYMDIVS